ncbi:MAG: M56 family metallopeptidase [Gemmatimonadetes bacterium]|nr:M56 family metallopeptidase [Gemmatimonadota bacterium]
MDFAVWLADWTLKSTVLFLAAGFLVVVLNRRSAALRHLIWGLAFGAALLLPALSFTTPRWSPPMALPLPTLAAGVEGVGAAGEAPENALPAPDVAALSARSAVARSLASGPPTRVAGEHRAPASQADWGSRVAGMAGRVAASWTSWLVPLWGAGCALVLVTLALAIVRTGRLRRLGRPAPGEAEGLLHLLAARLGLGRPVTLLVLDGNVMPMTFGVLRPVVLMPAAVATWGDDRLRAVVLHELAHVKRHDCLTQLVARAACALYWFNPLVWVAARRLRVERESACDDLVLAAGSRASEYATHLLEIARRRRAPCHPPTTGARWIACSGRGNCPAHRGRFRNCAGTYRPARRGTHLGGGDAACDPHPSSLSGCSVLCALCALCGLCGLLGPCEGCVPLRHGRAGAPAALCLRVGRPGTLYLGVLQRLRRPVHHPLEGRGLLPDRRRRGRRHRLRHR